jgi:N-acyl-D-aspartate/D-glutamate deacylase
VVQNHILITNGSVLDGSGTPATRTDLRLRDGRIVELGPGLEPQAERVLDATGLTVAPGFIDAHTHAEFIIASDRNAHYMEPFIRQGITTMVTGNCGVSPAPLNATCGDFLRRYWDCLLPGEGLGWQWRSVGEFLQRLSDVGPVVNVAQFVGHGSVRMSVMGYRSGRPTDEELGAMRALVRQSLEEGAIGVSYGLSYLPGIWSDTEELIEVARDLPQLGGRVAVHLRSHTGFLERAVAEMLRVAETLDVPLQLSHYAPFGVEFVEPYLRTLESVARARERGLEVGCDMLTPPVPSTTALQMLPPWLFEGGFEVFRERLSDPDVRERVREELERDPDWPSWETGGLAENSCSIRDAEGNPVWTQYRLNGFRSPAHRRYEFMTVDSIARDLGVDAYDALFDLTLAEGGGIFFTGTGVDDDEFDRLAGSLLYRIPEYSFMTDSVGIGRGARATTIYGTYPRFLGRHAREWETFTLEEAVRKATSLPAAQFGLADRGVIRVGNRADLVLFDAALVRDTATFAEPYQYPVGISSVILNGVPVWHDGSFDTEARAGQVLRPT